MTIFEFDELLGIVRAIEYDTPFNHHPDWPVRPTDVFPNDLVPIIITQPQQDLSEEEFGWNEDLASVNGSAGALRITPARMRWGFETSDRAQVIFNTRIETADELPLWKESFQQRRCLVPIRAFYEPHRSERAIDPRSGRDVKQLYRFTNEKALMLVAGIWKEDRFSILTTEQNDSVSFAHDRMPLILSQEHAHAWLLGDHRIVPSKADITLASAPLYPPQASVEQPRLF